MSTPTIERLAADAFEGLDLDDVKPDAEHRDEYLRTAVDGQVSPMTTELFSLVVNDNALAFLDYEGDASDPFTCLRGAIFDAVLDRLTELVDEALTVEVQ